VKKNIPVNETCAYCGAQARGYSRDSQGRRLCYDDTEDGPAPDCCYSLVTVYGKKPLSPAEAQKRLWGIPGSR
jgi:hypothetical protein